MKCNEAEKLILLKDSFELAVSKADSLTHHLRDCETCRDFQHTLMESEKSFKSADEPSVKVVQNVLREARLRAPEKKHATIFGWKPALGIAASLLIAMGITLTSVNTGKGGMDFVVTETQLLDTEDQIVSLMYEGLSEDDLAFNFLMTYEESIEG